MFTKWQSPTRFGDHRSRWFRCWRRLAIPQSLYLFWSRKYEFGGKNLSGLKGVFLSSSREYIKLYIYLIVLRSKVSCRCLYIYFTNLCRIKFSMKNTRRLEAIFHTATTRDSQILFQTKDKSVHVHCSRRPFEGKLQYSCI